MRALTDRRPSGYRLRHDTWKHARECDPSVRIRFPAIVLRTVRRAAKRSGRSQNSEIVLRLARSLGLARSKLI